MSVSSFGDAQTIRGPCAHTVPPIAYSRVQGSDEFGHDGVCSVQASEEGDDVGAWVGVLLGQGSIEEDCQGLSGEPANGVG
jgi:hypothetical protein